MRIVILLLFSFLFRLARASPLHAFDLDHDSVSNTDEQVPASRKWGSKNNILFQVPRQLQELNPRQTEATRYDPIEQLLPGSNPDMDARKTSANVLTSHTPLRQKKKSSRLVYSSNESFSGQTWMNISTFWNYFRNKELFRTTSLSTSNYQYLRKDMDRDLVRDVNSIDERDGLNFDSCSLTDECVPPRQCAEIIEGRPLPCSVDSKLCECIPVSDSSCFTSSDCDDGEVCEQIEQGSSVCVSETAGHGDGLNFDRCTEADGCARLRQCAQVEGNGFVTCRFDEAICVCTPNLSPVCDANDDCDDGERCEIISDTGDSICVSKNSDFFEVNEQPGPEEEDSSESSSPSSSPIELDDEPGISPLPSPDSDQFFDEDDDSMDLITPSINPSDLDDGPSLTPIPSQSSEQPPHEEDDSRDPIIPTPSPSELDEEPSPSAFPDSDSTETANNDPVSDAVCVDAMALTHLNEKDLVFDEHKMAVVLCDTFGSCATAGHMVAWNGKAMMMKTYCGGIGGCEENQMYVNSPKWRRGMRIESKTNGLEYTAFAARYESRTEEMILRTAVHIGL